MNDDMNRDLLLDLARLARKYPPRDWQAILTWVQDDAHRARLAALLQQVLAASREVRPGQRREAPPATIAALLETLLSEDQARAELLSDFWRKLLTRDVLPTPASLRLFAEVVSLKPPTSKKREQAVNDIIRQLAPLPLADLRAALEKASAASAGLGAEYQRWVSLIMTRR